MEEQKQKLVYANLFSVKFNFPGFKKAKELSDIVEGYNHAHLKNADLMGLVITGDVEIDFVRCELLIEFLKEQYENKTLGEIELICFNTEGKGLFKRTYSGAKVVNPTEIFNHLNYDIQSSGLENVSFSYNAFKQEFL